MRTLIAIITFLASFSVHAEDMQKYLRDTDKMIEQGKYQEALDRCIWFHEHALEHEPAMYGVRLSFALSDWKRLGDVFPPAMAALKKTRDDKTALMIDKKGNFNLFQDVASLNQTLGEDKETVVLFRKLDQEQKDLATRCWELAKEAVIKTKAYDLAKKYLGNPVLEFNTIKERYDENVKMYGGKNFGAHFKSYNQNHFVKETLLLLDVTAALDDTTATKEIRGKALAVIDDPRLREAIPKDAPIIQSGTATPALSQKLCVTPEVKQAFHANDGIKISEVTGTTSKFQVGGTYRVVGVCLLDTLKHATLYIGNTAEPGAEAIVASAGSSLSKSVEKGSTPFDITFTLLRPGILHITLYDVDKRDKNDNAYAGVYLGDVVFKH